MAGVIYNPSAANVYYDVSGSAISAQPTLTGRVKGAGATNSFFSNVGFGEVDKGFMGSRIYATNQTSIITSKLGDAVNITSVAASSGRARYTLNGHSLVVGDVIYVSDSSNKVTGIQRVRAKATNTFDTDKTYTSGAGTLTYKLISGTLAYGAGAGGLYSVMRKVSTTINNVANTALQSGGAPDAYRKSPKKFMTAGRCYGAATAIRAGYWNEYSGSWSTAPTATNTSIGNVAGSTVTDGSADHAGNVSRSTAGELVYRYGAAAAATADYNLPTA